MAEKYKPPGIPNLATMVGVQNIAAERFGETVDEVLKSVDPSKRQAKEIERRGKEALRSSISNIRGLEGLEATRAAEEGYGDAALQTDQPFMTEAQRKQVTAAAQDKLTREREDVMSKGLELAHTTAERERSLDSGVEEMRNYLRSQGMSEPNISKTEAMVDPQNLRKAQFDKLNTEDIAQFANTTPTPVHMSNATIDEQVAQLPIGQQAGARIALEQKRDRIRTDYNYTQKQLLDDTVEDAQTYYRKTGDRAGAKQRITRAGLKGQGNVQALKAFNDLADLVEQLSQVEKIELDQVMGDASDETAAQSQAAQDLLETQRANYEARINATSTEVAQEAERFNRTGEGVVQLLNKPAENAGIIKRIINMDVQFHDDAAEALSSGLQGIIDRGVPEEYAAVFLKKAMAKNYGANQAIGSGTGVDPDVLMDTLDEYAKEYIGAKEDREKLAENEKAKVALDRQLRQRERTFVNAYTTDLYRRKAVPGSESQVPQIMEEYVNSRPKFKPAEGEGEEKLKEEAKKPATPQPQPESAAILERKVEEKLLSTITDELFEGDGATTPRLVKLLEESGLSLPDQSRLMRQARKAYKREGKKLTAAERAYKNARKKFNK